MCAYRKIKIKEPIWKTRSIGIAEYKMTTSKLKIEIIYKNKYGTRLYPKPFYIFKDKAMKYPKQVIKGIDLRIIPINHLETT